MFDVTLTLPLYETNLSTKQKIFFIHPFKKTNKQNHNLFGVLWVGVFLNKFVNLNLLVGVFFFHLKMCDADMCDLMCSCCEEDDGCRSMPCCVLEHGCTRYPRFSPLLYISNAGQFFAVHVLWPLFVYCKTVPIFLFGLRKSLTMFKITYF